MVGCWQADGVPWGPGWAVLCAVLRCAEVCCVVEVVEHHAVSSTACCTVEWVGRWAVGSVGGVVVCVYRVANQWLVSAGLVGRDRGRRLNFVCPGCPVYVCRLVHVCTEVA